MTVIYGGSYRGSSNFPQLIPLPYTGRDGLTDQRQHDAWLLSRLREISTALVFTAAPVQVHSGHAVVVDEQPLAGCHGRIGLVDVTTDELAERRARRANETFTDLYKRGA